MGYIRDHIKHQTSPSITLRGHWMGELGLRPAGRLKYCVSRGN
ncbi:type I toxin-antitoxin system SymE family toxin [Rosenbergiella epipactidis]